MLPEQEVLSETINEVNIPSYPLKRSVPGPSLQVCPITRPKGLLSSLSILRRAPRSAA